MSIRKTSFVVAFVAVLAFAVSAYAQEQVFKISVEAANIRFEPNTTSPVIGRAERGTVLKVIGQERGWFRVVLSAKGAPEKVGYVLGQLGSLETVRVASAPTPAPVPVPAPAVKEEPAPVVVTTTPPPSPATVAAYSLFIKAAETDGFADSELEDSAKDFRDNVKRQNFLLASSEATANVLLVITKREKRLGEPTGAAGQTASILGGSKGKNLEVADIWATLSVKRGGKWVSGIRLSSNSCCMTWRAARDRVIDLASKWLEQNMPLSSAPVRAETAQTTQAAATPPPAPSKPRRFGVGLYLGAAPGGVAPSVLYDLTDRVTLNAALGLYTGVTGVTGELLYRFPQPSKSPASDVAFEPYLGGGLMLVSVDYGLGSESFTGFIGSGGTFLTVSKIPRWRFSGDINLVRFNVGYIAVSGVGIRLGAHYMF